MRLFDKLLALALVFLVGGISFLFNFSSLVLLFFTIVFVGFFTTMFIARSWIKIAHRIELVGKDMNKHHGENVAESGGISVIMGITFALLFFVFIRTFVLGSEQNLVQILTIVITVLLAGILGFVDDIIGWKVGLKQWQKPLLTIPIAIPLIVINAGNHVIDLPLFGFVDFGLAYPLLIIPIALLGAANGFNMLAGLNGLEAGMGMVILSALGVGAFYSGSLWLATLTFAMVFCLLGFFMYNRFPAKLFPGDSMTYAIGALIATIAIVGNMQKMAVFLFIPYFIELVLKARRRFKGESFVVPNPDGTVNAPRINSLTQVSVRILQAVKGTATEQEAVYLILLGQIVLSAASLLYFIL